MNHPEKVISIEAARSVVIDRLAKAEQAADRQRIEQEQQAENAKRDADERRARAATLRAENEAKRERLAALDTEAGKLVLALTANFRAREQLAAEVDANTSRARDLTGESAPRWGESTADAQRATFARTVKASLRKANTSPGGFFAWLDHRAILFAH